MTISDTFPTISRLVADDFIFFSKLETGQYDLDFFILKAVKFHPLFSPHTRSMTISDSFPTISRLVADDFLIFSELETGQYDLDFVILKAVKF